MTSVIPPRFLFRYSIPILHVPRLPRKGRKLLDLPKDCVLPRFDQLDGEQPFGALSVAWNDQGLALSLLVTGKTTPLSGNAKNPADGDGLQVWIDTRNTQSIHRASRFCHHFCILPAGFGAKLDQPSLIQLPIARARDETPLAKPSDFQVAVEHLPNGYRLEAWLPSETLNGFDPEANSLLGFYYCLRDAQLGDQFLTVGWDFPFTHDPSLWSTLELVR